MSGGGIPYLGSKISLISNADIRYEGILYTIDTKESTVALAKVRTFGTEERETKRPVPARDEVFEYIIFRGRDIKDLRVCEGPPPQQVPDLGPPQDPAIVKSSIGDSRVPGYPPGHTDHQHRQISLAPQQQTQQQHEVLPQQQQLPPQQPGYGYAPPPTSQPVVQPPTTFAQATSQSAQHQNLQHGRGATAPLARRSPTVDTAVQTTTQGPRGGSPPTVGSPPGDRGNRRGGHDHGAYNNQANRQPRTANVQRGGRQDRRGTGFRAHRGGGARGRGGPRPNTGNRKLEFEGEFDFESANAQFDKDEFEKEMKQKLTIGDKPVAVNGDNNKDSDNEQEVVEEDAADNDEIFYDRSKSFFDNISCEATERAKGTNTRPNWREERKLNTETFGQSGVRRGGRRGMRGGYGYNYYNNRGQYRGQGRGRGGGGQYNRGRGNFNNNRGGGGGGGRGRPRNQGWVDYDFDYAAAGIERNNLNNKPAAAAKS